MIDIAVLAPVLRRPHRVRPLVDSLFASTDRARLVFIATQGDMEEIAAIKEVDHPLVTLLTLPPNQSGDYARKINHGFRNTTEPWILTGADDLHFHPGWVQACQPYMNHPRVGVIGTQDLGNQRVLAGRHSTHSLVRRTYVDQYGVIDAPGLVLHEGYPHEFVDDELVQTAMSRRMWGFARDAHVEHLHPNWGKADSDPLYEAQLDRIGAGRVLFNERRKMWIR